MFYDLSVLLSRDRYRPIYTVSIWMLVYTSAVIPLHPTSRATFEPAIEPGLIIGRRGHMKPMDRWPNFQDILAKRKNQKIKKVNLQRSPRHLSPTPPRSVTMAPARSPSHHKYIHMPCQYLPSPSNTRQPSAPAPNRARPAPRILHESVSPHHRFLTTHDLHDAPLNPSPMSPEGKPSSHPLRQPHENPFELRRLLRGPQLTPKPQRGEPQSLQLSGNSGASQ
jgi:hypothetical protein